MHVQYLETERILVPIVKTAFHFDLLHSLPPVLHTSLYKAIDLSSILKMHDLVIRLCGSYFNTLLLIAYITHSFYLPGIQIRHVSALFVNLPNVDC
jgi:hypothetical protein